MTAAWEDASTATYTAESTVIGGKLVGRVLTVTVCLDDEGPLRPAFYWDVADADGRKIIDGWASTVAGARRDAIAAARGEIHP